jgi:hypothetical protein
MTMVRRLLQEPMTARSAEWPSAVRLPHDAAVWRGFARVRSAAFRDATQNPSPGLIISGTNRARSGIVHAMQLCSSLIRKAAPCSDGGNTVRPRPQDRVSGATADPAPDAGGRMVSTRRPRHQGIAHQPALIQFPSPVAASGRADGNPTVNITMPPDQFSVSFSGTIPLASHIHAMVISSSGAADACGR